MDYKEKLLHEEYLQLLDFSPVQLQVKEINSYHSFYKNGFIRVYDASFHTTFNLTFPLDTDVEEAKKEWFVQYYQRQISGHHRRQSYLEEEVKRRGKNNRRLNLEVIELTNANDALNKKIKYLELPLYKKIILKLKK